RRASADCSPTQGWSLRRGAPARAGASSCERRRRASSRVTYLWRVGGSRRLGGARASLGLFSSVPRVRPDLSRCSEVSLRRRGGWWGGPAGGRPLILLGLAT